MKNQENLIIESVKIKRTKIGNSYWNNNGAYQKELESLEALVPSSGPASTLHGELIRGVGRLTYEFNNNGNMNAVDIKYCDTEYPCSECCGSGMIDAEENEVCEECGGSGTILEEEVDSVEVDEFFGNFLKLMRDNLINKIKKQEVEKIIDEIENIIENSVNESGSNYFSEKNALAYNKMADYVIWYVLNTENSEYVEY